ncbi:hypothetical protein [Glutamicibacter sp. X7]
MEFTHVAAQHGQWIATACQRAQPATVAAQVPAGYERYVRILHPALDEEGRSHRWAEVARATGETLQATSLFEDVARLDERGLPLDENSWVDSDLPGEELATEQWQALSAHLGAATAQERLILGLWAGYAFIEGGERIDIESAAESGADAEDHAAALAEARRPGFSDEVLRAPRLELPGGYRNYLLFDADHEFLAAPQWATTAAGAQKQHPSLVFPTDRSWLLSTEPYDDSTIVGGSAALIEALCADDRLETLEVGELTRIGHSA